MAARLACSGSRWTTVRVLGLGGIALSGVLLLPEAALAVSDKAFIEEAIKGDNSEVKLGRIAADRGESSDVKTFGSTLATDHGQAKTQALDVARALGLHPTDDVSDEAKAEAYRLQGLSGAKFDAEFARYMIDDHEKEIKKFKEKAKAGDSAVSKHAASVLPVLEKHLDTAKSIAQKSGTAATGASSGEGKPRHRAP